VEWGGGVGEGEGGVGWGWESICVVPTSSDTLAGKVVENNFFPQCSVGQYMNIFTLLGC